MIYRVHFYDDADGSRGYEFVTTRRAADRLLAEWRKDAPDMRQAATIDTFPTPRTKTALLALLREVGSHADNG